MVPCIFGTVLEVMDCESPAKTDVCVEDFNEVSVECCAAEDGGFG